MNAKFASSIILSIVCAISLSFSNPVLAGDKLTSQKVHNAVWQFLEGSAGGLQVIGVLEVPQQNVAKADLVIQNWLLATPKNDPVTAYALGPGGQTFKWSGRAVAVFVHYNDGRWVLNRVAFERGTFDNLNIVAR
ncbi:TPA: hypothetical protein DIV48_00515 [Candidatus Kaiserbacteria bacterium]|nr:MAG: hypothetical protein UY93_C0002G0437 [Parcubacteria group bacterium GW2011_GWA1_56_13]KKW46613.1 MAG: hypothetical protein UY97_C0004G0002 [Parcubacteria group bacterium GW2011_GWB1_57_6]HCR52114.1 hypothetical protein [Candidatus Kaiserbacteria bacterium]